MAISLDPEVGNTIPSHIKKVGVFVNETIDEIKKAVEKYQLDFIQLHGDESADNCRELNNEAYKIIKAFQLHKDFNFEQLNAYKNHCQYFLFDTQTILYGGSGQKFDWEILRNYDNEKAFFLSGGIDLEDAETISELKNMNIHAIDINSKFEIKPGLKDINKIKKFKFFLTEIHREMTP